MNKKLIFCIIVTVILTSCFFMLSGFTMTLIDTSYNFNYAYIFTPDGGNTFARGKVEQWKDWDNSDMLQVKIDGKVYYTHSSNIILVQE